MSKRTKLMHDESGSVLIMVAASLVVILGFLALGVEAGRWYLVRAELSKSVDAGALAGAKNISNPHVDPKTIAEEFSQANFPSGYLGTPNSGNGTAGFVASLDGDRVKVDGTTFGRSVLAQLFGTDHVAIGTLGTAQMKNVEIMLVLDRSGSMAGTPISDLKTASKSFIGFFQDTQADDRVGLISFATSVTLERPLGPDFVTPLNTKIDNMNAVGATNPSDALALANGPNSFTDQSALPPNRRKPQFLIFFSDGRPTAFRGNFIYRNNPMDAVGCVTGNCEPWDIGQGVQTYSKLGYPTTEQWYPVDPRTTGDGRYPTSACGNPNSTRWLAFDSEPVPGYTPTACNIPYRTDLAAHICNLAASHTVTQADLLKARGITIYTIGLGNANPDFLASLATGPEQVYFTPTSAELNAIFQKIAKQIKLRMVQ